MPTDSTSGLPRRPNRGDWQLTPRMPLGRAARLFSVAAGVLILAVCIQQCRSQWQAVGALHFIDTSSQIYGARVFGDNVAIVLEAKSHTVLDPIPKDFGIRGYLITANLTSEKKIDAARNVTGPLYEIDDSVSSAASSTGAPFNKQDRKVMSQKPYLSFRNGALVKSVLADDGKNCSDWALKVDGKKAHWVEIGKHPLLLLLGRHSEFYFESQSRRYAVQREADGKTHIYDTYAGKSIENPWLEKVAADFFSREDLENSVIKLSDDLNSLIILPRSGLQIKRGDETVVIEDLTIDGKTFQRKGRLVAYQRPSEQPKVGVRGDSWMVVVTADGNVLSLTTSNDQIELHNLDNLVVYSHALTPDESWIKQSFKDGSDSRVVFTDGPGLIGGRNRPGQDILKVAAWDFRAGKLVQYSIHIADLFEQRIDGYYPKAAISIEK